MDFRKERIPDQDAIASPGPVGEPALLTAGEAARFLRARRSWVYANARELGGFRPLGDRGPWRFNRYSLLAPPAATPARAATPTPAPAAQAQRRAKRDTSPAADQATTRRVRLRT